MENIYKRLISIFLIIMILVSTVFNYKEVLYAANGTLRIELKESITDIPIANAQFRIFKKSDRSVFYTKTTNERGIIQIDIPEEDYIVKQISTPSPYVIQTAEIPVTVRAEIKQKTIGITNIKQGSNPVTDNGVTTLRLKLVNSDNTLEVIPNGKFLVKGKNVNVEITTGRDGYAYLSGLREGESYTISQIGEVDGYISKPDDTILYIPDPPDPKYSEYADVTIGNVPYDRGKFGVLTIHTEEDFRKNGVQGKRVPYVKVKITDDQGNIQIGVTDSNGVLKVKNVSWLRTYRAEIIEVPYEYDQSNYVFVENIKINQFGNTQTQTLYLPKAQLGLLTINNYETGDFGVKISGSTFKLIHPDGTSREITIENGVKTINLPFIADEQKYKLIQLTTDGTHKIKETAIEFAMSRPVEINVNNDLKNPELSKVSVSFQKVWGDVPSSEKTAVIKLLADGKEVAGQKYTLRSSEGNVSRTFTNLPKYDATHTAINYSVVEDPITDWYAEYEQLGVNQWKITNYEGSLADQCFVDPNKGVLFYSTDSVAYMAENGDKLIKTFTLSPPGYHQSFGHGIAYDRNNNILYAVNKDGYLAVVNVARGTNGTIEKVVKLPQLYDDAKLERVSGEYINSNFRKVNTLETSVDGKYIIGRALAGNNFYFYRISDILSASNGGDVPVAKTVYARHTVEDNKKTPVVDGDVVQFNNGDILYTGHANQFFNVDFASPQRGEFKLWYLKYRGDVNDVASGSYDQPVSVGYLNRAGQANSWRDGSSNNFDFSVEGLVYMNNRIYFTSNITHKGQIIEWNMGIIDNADLLVNDPQPGRQIDFKLHSLKNVNRSLSVEAREPSIRRRDMINHYFGGENNLVTRIPELNSQFSDMTGAPRERCNPVVKVEGYKSWVGDDEQTRPNSIEVELYANGQPYNNGIGSKVTLNAENNWKYSFLSLPKNDDSGRRINYSVKEINTPDNYLVTYQGYSIINTLLKGSFSIKKTNLDRSQSLKGAKFSLWNEDETKQISTTQITGEDGIVTFNNLTSGTYYLIEDEAPYGYFATQNKYKVVGTLNQENGRVDFVISNNGTNLQKDSDKFVITNTKPKFKIQIAKVDSETGNIIKKDTRFSITDKDGNIINRQVSTFNGVYTFDNGGNKFEPGEYYLKEETAPKGYTILDSPIKIVINSDGTAYLDSNNDKFASIYGTKITKSDVIRIAVKNENKNYPLSIQKLKGVQNGDARDTLVGVRLKLRAKENTNTENPQFNDLSWHTDVNRYAGVVENDGSLTWNSSNSGDAVFLVKPGKYVLTEISTKTGYKLLRQEGIEIVVKDNGEIKILEEGIEIDTLSLDNVIVGKVGEKDNRKSISLINYFEINLKITKLSTLNNTPLGGAIFEIYSDENLTTKVATSAVTGTDGIAKFSGEPLKAGTYYLKEKTAPLGYWLNEKAYKIIINEDGTVRLENGDDKILLGTIEPNRELSATIKNEPIKPKDIKIYKVNTNGEKIQNPNSQFKIYSSNQDGSVNTNDLMDHHTVNNIDVTGRVGEGHLDVFNNRKNSSIGYKKGLYYLEEVTAPNGYRVLPEKVAFYINDDGSVIIPAVKKGENYVKDTTKSYRDFFESSIQQDYEYSEKTLIKLKVKNERKITLHLKKRDKEQVEIYGELTITNSDQLDGVVANSNPRENFKKLQATFKLEKKEGESWVRVIPNTTTNNSGYLSVENLKEGKYKLTEITPPIGYKEISPIVFEITATNEIKYYDSNEIQINNNSNAKIFYHNNNATDLVVAVKNEMKKYNFKIIKTKTNGEQIQGSRFAIKLSPNKTRGEEVYNGQVANLSSQGYVFSNNDSKGFLPGTYYLVEETSPSGYEKIDPVKIVLFENGSISIDDTEINGSIDKVGPVTVEKDTNTIVFKVENKKLFNFHLKKRDKDQIETHGESNITNSSQVDGNVGNTNTPYKKLQATFILEKKVSKDNEVENYEIINLSDGGRTDSNGYLKVDNLVEGEYKLTETKSPNGYKLLENPIKFIVTATGVETLSGNEDAKIFFNEENKKNLVVLVKNSKSNINLKIKKVEYENENKSIDGVVFQLYSKNPENNEPGTLEGEYTTSNGGIITLENVDVGEYFLKEKSVPLIPETVQRNTEYKLDKRYYKIIVTKESVTIVDKALIKNKDEVFEEVDIGTDKKLVLGNLEENTQELIFKNEKRFRVSFEKDLFTEENKPRLSGIKFSIRAKDENTKKPELVEYNPNLVSFSLIEDKTVDGKTIEEGSLVWSFDPKKESVNPHLFNPIFSLGEGSYIVEELNPPDGYEKVEFELKVSEDGEISAESVLNGIDGVKNVPEPNQKYIFVDGNILWIRQKGFNNTNASMVHIYNKKPMEFYVNKNNHLNKQIRFGKLKLKLENANIFEKGGNKTDEVVFDLANDYISGKGIKIEIPKELETGTYILTELEAPDGYTKTNNRYYIEVNQFKRTIKLLKIDTGEGTEITKINKILYKEIYDNNTISAVPITTTMEIINKSKEYPYTGGQGEMLYMLGGFLIMLTSVFILNKKRKN